MKKFLSISLLLSMLFLYGCSTSDKLTANQLFEKKQECTNYQDQMKEDLAKRYPADIIDQNLYVDEIFYSPQKNSCLYHAELVSGDTHLHHIIDFLTKESLMFCVSALDENCYDSIKKEMKELK